MRDDLARKYGLYKPEEVNTWMAENTAATMKGGKVVERTAGCELVKEAGDTVARLGKCAKTKAAAVTRYPDDTEAGSYGIAAGGDDEKAAPTVAATTRLTKVILPPGEPLYFQAPPPDEIRSDGIYAFRWNSSQVFGHVAELEPTNELLWSVLRMDPRPKVIVFTPPADRERVAALVLAVARVLTGRLKFAVADGSDGSWAAALQSFGVESGRAETEAVAVLTDTRGLGERKGYKAICEQAGAALTAASLLSFAEKEARGGASAVGQQRAV